MAREVNHKWGPKKKKAEEKEAQLGGELADILFTISCMANSWGVDLTDEFSKVMDKLYGRDKDRWEKK